jgi:catechol 2,3-dioxygenase-like lactoylglutathione lyase family enzyme
VFDHVEIHVSDLAASRAFYREALGLPTADGELVEWGDFGIVAVDGEHPLSRNLHIAFGVETRDDVDAWWNRMTGAGYASDGEPGLRPEYTATYYGAFVLDPDGNSVEAVHHHRSRTGEIDHIWLRTADVQACRRFYGTIAPSVDIELVGDQPDLVRWSDGEGSFTFVSGTARTENVHLAFGVADFDEVKRFHALALAAGYRDNGKPGERLQYHPGYFGAFVFDPDGHNVEAVFHSRS